MLAASREAIYLHEPLNPVSPLLRVPVERQYLYLTDENEDGYPEAFARLLRFPLDARKAERSRRQRLRRIGRLLHGRMTGARALLKDPFAAFSIPWFVRRLRAEVVVVVRRPLSVAGSAKAMGWGFDSRWLLDQPELMRDRLEPFRAELEAQPDTLAGQSALLWQIVYSIARDDADRLPAVRLVRHEDLCREPVQAFTGLYESLGLAFGTRARRALERTAEGREATLESWRERLTPGEAEDVEGRTAELERELYS
jgi:hypothetical protein